MPSAKRPPSDQSPSPREVRWERMFPDELEAAFERRPLAWFVYGLCEPHGPHNTLGLDALKAHALACEAARRFGGIVAPPDYWHVHEIGRFAFGSGPKIGEGRTWLTAVPPWIHYRNVLYHIRAADAHGFHGALLMTGHGGPQTQDFKTLIDYWQPHFSTRLLALGDFDVLPEGKGDHAGFIETSQLWHLAPECVDVSRLPPVPQPHPNFATGADAHLATRRDGERMVAYQIEALGRKADELLAGYEIPPGGRMPVSFFDVDELWAATVRDIFPDMEIMVQQLEGWPPPPNDSQWMLNYKLRLPQGS